jgi:RNA polymerase sigma-70 factor (ECF subfamily)
MEEAARILNTSEVSVKGALQRARRTLAKQLPIPARGEHERDSERERALARRFAAAFQDDDLEGVVALLTEDAWLTMPPYPHAYQGVEAIVGFLGASASWRNGRRYALVPTNANGQAAFGSYLQDPVTMTFLPAGLIVLTLSGDGISRITRFMDASIFRCFGLP